MAGLVGVPRREDRARGMPAGGSRARDPGGARRRDRGRRAAGDCGVGLPCLPSDHALLHVHPHVGVHALERARGVSLADPRHAGLRQVAAGRRGAGRYHKEYNIARSDVHNRQSSLFALHVWG